MKRINHILVSLGFFGMAFGMVLPLTLLFLCNAAGTQGKAGPAVAFSSITFFIGLLFTGCGFVGVDPSLSEKWIFGFLEFCGLVSVAFAARLGISALPETQLRHGIIILSSSLVAVVVFTTAILHTFGKRI